MLCWREGQAQGKSMEEEGWELGVENRTKLLPRP